MQPASAVRAPMSRGPILSRSPEERHPPAAIALQTCEATPRPRARPMPFDGLLLGRGPAVDDEFGPGDKRRFIRGQVDDPIGDIFWLSDSSQRQTLQPLFP